MNTVLTIAGSDTSAGAGIQQDLKTITAHGAYGATVITALTSQNTMGVQGVTAVSEEVVLSQLTSVLSDLDVQAIKIGQIPNAEVAHTIASALSSYFKEQQKTIPLVYDPVMISTSGRRLMSEGSMDTIINELFPLCTLITPNIPEAEHLFGRSASYFPKDEKVKFEDMEKAGKSLASYFKTNILIKGGHAEGDTMTDSLFSADGEMMTFSSPKVETTNLHGTGCTLSSAIACNLATGKSLAEAIGQAKEFVTEAIRGGKDLHIGHGNGPLWNF